MTLRQTRHFSSLNMLTDRIVGRRKCKAITLFASIDLISIFENEEWTNCVCENEREGKKEREKEREGETLSLWDCEWAIQMKLWLSIYYGQGL